MLLKAPGVERKEDGFAIGEEHRASLYIGAAGQTTSVTEVVRVALYDGFVEVEVRDRTRHFVPYEPILGLAVRPPREDVPRTGF